MSWLVIVSFRLSLLCFLWHGCHVPLTPDPSPSFRGRGEDFVFLWSGYGCRGAFDRSYMSDMSCGSHRTFLVWLPGNRTRIPAGVFFPVR